MPIYEFVCRGCETAFEELVRADTRVECPSCGSAEVRKLLSSFSAVGGARPDGCPDPGGCEPDACRGGGACMIN
ncbi:MAG: hypothetical protein CME06_02245 [Gemmatimonadetes bacterium]|nr:hypothetical protein [Gemmatimonadota bacterium]